jgi:hypothetical protein
VPSVSPTPLRLLPRAPRLVSFEDAGSDGGPATVADYGLYSDGVKVASFAEGRIGYREWTRRNGRLADINGLKDRYDYDVDELMAEHRTNTAYRWPRLPIAHGAAFSLSP